MWSTGPHQTHEQRRLRAERLGISTTLGHELPHQRDDVYTARTLAAIAGREAQLRQVINNIERVLGNSDIDLEYGPNPDNSCTEATGNIIPMYDGAGDQREMTDYGGQLMMAARERGADMNDVNHDIRRNKLNAIAELNEVIGNNVDTGEAQHEVVGRVRAASAHGASFDAILGPVARLDADAGPVAPALDADAIAARRLLRAGSVQRLLAAPRPGFWQRAVDAHRRSSDFQDMYIGGGSRRKKTERSKTLRGGGERGRRRADRLGIGRQQVGQGADFTLAAIAVREAHLRQVINNIEQVIDMPTIDLEYALNPNESCTEATGNLAEVPAGLLAAASSQGLNMTHVNYDIERNKRNALAELNEVLAEVDTEESQHHIVGRMRAAADADFSIRGWHTPPDHVP